MNGEGNIINVQKEDREFIQIIKTLAPEKKNLIKGIVIGLQLQDKKMDKVAG